NAATIYIYFYVEVFFDVGQGKWLLYFVLQCCCRKIVAQVPLVNSNVTFSFGNINSGNRSFSSTNFMNHFHYLKSFKLIAVGFCASWLWVAPVYTFRLRKSSAPNLFLGNIPFIDFSIIRAGSL